MNRRIAGFALAAFFVLTPSAFADEPRITLDMIYGKSHLPFTSSASGYHVWLDDERIAWPELDAANEVTGWRLHDLRSGKESEFFAPPRAEKAFAKIEGDDEKKTRGATREKALQFDPAGRRLLFTVRGDLYLYDIASEALHRLTATREEEEEASFSHDGKLVAFVRGNDLYLFDLGTGKEKQLTFDGSADILNGKLDWVYQEEVYGRGNYQAYWWSPDSRTIAFLRIDQTKVPRFAIVDDIPYHQEIDEMRYPKAGDPNPAARLYLVDVQNGNPKAAEHPYEEETLIVNVGWKPDSSVVSFQVQNRTQTWLDLNVADRANGKVTKLLRETTGVWLEPWGSPLWLRDGSFLWLSERSGWQHLYRIAADGHSATPLTSGDFEVREIHGADERRGFVYFSSSERSATGVDPWRVSLRGGERKRLTDRAGTHRVAFNRSMTTFIDQWSDVWTPHHTFVVSSEGAAVTTLRRPDTSAIDRLGLSRPQFLQVPTRDGFVMEAQLILPRNLVAGRRYPIYQYVYGGPHAPEVENRWRGSHNYFHQLLAEHGIAVWMLDNRTASGKGSLSTRSLYKELGQSELRDLEDGVVWLAKQPWADTSRMVMSGWSYGGFMTSYALTHSDRWIAGIAGGPVTDWRDYDTIYTERYLLTPQENPDGYRKSSPRFAAESLNGRLLLIHGTTDDNVHLQNTIQFAQELQKAGKQFEMMLYPQTQHGIIDKKQVQHSRQLMLDFVLQNIASQ